MAEIVSRRSITYDILFEVEQGKKSAKAAEKELGKIDKTAGKLDSTLNKAGAALAAAFATEKLIAFGKEAVLLAAKAEGVTKAFNRLNDATLLNELRSATKGTIDDLTLMQAAVRADKFKIPLKELGGLFAFARQRARETGQEVNFLVNSIVDGIGRKSPLILDNLGLSASALQQEFRKTGDFAKAAGEVIRKEMILAGDSIETTADTFAVFAANMENFKLAIGNALLPFINDFVEGLNFMNEAFSNAPPPIRETISALDDLRSAVKNGKLSIEDQLVTIDNLRQVYEDVVKQFGEADAGAQQLKQQIELLEASLSKAADEGINGFRNRIDLLQESLNDINAGGRGNLGLLSEQLEDIKKRFTDTQAPIDFSKEQLFEYTNVIADLEKQIKALTEAQTRLAAATEITTEKLSPTEARDRIIEEIKESRKRQEEREKELGLTIKFAQDVGNVAEEAVRKQFELSDALKENLITNAQDTLIALTTLFGEGSKAGLAFAGVQIFADQAKALSGAIAAATQAASTSGGFSLPLLISSFVSIALSSFAQVNALLNRARAEQATVSEAFAEGEVDIHRPGEKRGKDSIPAMIMPGESVMTTEETARYKPILEAIRSGTLEDLIHQNYVQPELAVNALDHAKNDSKELDYSERFYRQLIATGEGNDINKLALRHLRNIDKKLTTNKSYKR